MKPGKVGAILLLSSFMFCAGVAVIEHTEIPKLENRVDELTVQNQQLEQDLGITQSELLKRVEAYKALDSQKEQLRTELEEKSVQVDALEAEKAKLQQEVEELKNKVGKVVGTDFQVTWYNDTGKTATGTYTSDGRTVAVDPRIIPYGSKLKITMPDGTVYYRTAEDTGGAVKSKNGGKVVDIYANVSTEELYQRGRTRGVKVEIL